MKLPSKKPLSVTSLTNEEFDKAIKESIRDFENGDVYTTEQVKNRLNNKYGIYED